MIDLKAIRDRLNAATPGEWHSYANTVPVGYAKGNDVRVGLDNFICRDASCADMNFIANAKQDIAALIEAVERLEPFLDYCAGEGVLIGGVDSADLYIEMFPEKYRAALSAKDKGEENA